MKVDVFVTFLYEKEKWSYKSKKDLRSALHSLIQ